MAWLFSCAWIDLWLSRLGPLPLAKHLRIVLVGAGGDDCVPLHPISTVVSDPRRAHLRSRPTSHRPRSRTYVAQTYVAGHVGTRRQVGRRASSSPTPPCTTIQRPGDAICALLHLDPRRYKRPGAALRALPRLDADERRAGSCNPCSPAPRRYNGQELQFVLSYASTIQWPGAAPRALPRLDDTMAGRCNSCSPTPRRYNGRELRLVLSCASTPMREGPGAAIRALPCLDARRDKGQGLRSSTPAPRRMTRPRPGAALRALPHLDAARTTRQSR
ncbi:hypothetical protein B0H13DRAFT_1901526 [Mycena leptocephala]|nr:hypothetical protein B0H13DRAFT_1901526 [Mycena leptocephala]